MEGKKEGNVLFNDALNTFYLRLYGVTHMVKDHSDSERVSCAYMESVIINHNKIDSLVVHINMFFGYKCVMLGLKKTPHKYPWKMREYLTFSLAQFYFQIWYGRRKKMFYLTIHIAHFIFMVIWRRLYGKGTLSEKENLLLPLHELLFLISSNISFICTNPNRIAHHSLCYTSCGALTERLNSLTGPP